MKSDYIDETLDRIIETLNKEWRSTSKNRMAYHSFLQDLYQFVHNPIENRVYDVYSHTIIPNDLYDRLKEKYPEEFLGVE